MMAAAGYRASTSLDEAAAQRVAALMSEALWPPPDAVGLFEEEAGRWRVDAYFSEKPDSAALRDFLRGHVPAGIEFSIETVADADWVAVAQARLHPVRAGRFIVHGSHDRGRVPRGRWAIEIEAGRAFGTGHHGSTLGCLEAIHRLAKRERFRRVLDLGTGAGILAIAAARTWRGRIVASDIDPVAVATARENAVKNGVGARIRVVEAEGLCHPLIRRGMPYDLVLANILARPLIAMAKEIVRGLRPGGSVVVSGITRDQAARVAAAFRAAGCTRLGPVVIGDWVTLILRRRTA